MGMQTHGKDSSDSLRAETRSRSLACSTSAGTGTVGNSRALNMSVNGTKRVPGALTVGLQMLVTGRSHNPTSNIIYTLTQVLQGNNQVIANVTRETSVTDLLLSSAIVFPQ